MAEYDKRKTRKAMLLSPLVGALAVLPFLMFLNLSVGQWFAIILVAIVVSYVLATIVGGLGYFVLKRLGKHEDMYLYGYAAALVILFAIAYADFYALISVGPPVLIATAAFCYFRGKPTWSPS